MNEEASWEERLASLKASFDQSFSLERPPVRLRGARLGAISVAGRPFAVRLSELQCIVADRPFAQVPGGGRSSRGLSGIRGRLVAVHSLADLLSLDGSSGEERWLLQCAADPSVGLSFEEFEGTFDLDLEQVQVANAEEQPSELVRELIHDGRTARPLIGISRILSLIEARIGSGRPREKRPWEVPGLSARSWPPRSRPSSG
jgi:chemotaxis signal transduction protein